jgi:RND superfamily putative drug exporter
MDTPVTVRLTSGRNKRTDLAYAWWLLLGIFGAHHFYLGRPGRGVLYLCTAGLFLIGWISDAFTLPEQVRRINTIGW